MLNEQLNTLLDLCLLELQITWRDDDTNARVMTHIKNGVAYIKSKCGVSDEAFTAGSEANALLLAYVRRAVSGDISTFEADYLRAILDLQIDFEVSGNGE